MLTLNIHCTVYNRSFLNSVKLNNLIHMMFLMFVFLESINQSVSGVQPMMETL